jgi:membrane protein YdbS with pleckstrin-like domain
MPGRPNATFTEPDWLGIFLVLLIAVIYSLIYYFKSLPPNLLSLGERVAEGRVRENATINPNNQNTKYKMLNTKCLIHYTLYILLIPCYILLTLTVSRSAWLGAIIITLIFLKIILTQASWRMRNWQWKEFFKQSIFIFSAGLISVAIVYVFQLTSFQLFDRAESAGSGLQKITISCREDMTLPEKINYSEELIKYNCRHINLEEIPLEKGQGYYIREIYRDDPNVVIRSQIYQKSWEVLKNHPLVGIGWESIGKVLGTDERGASLNSSNIFLEVWLGSGILGLLAFLVILTYIFIQSIRNLLKENTDNKLVGLFGILGLMALLVPNLFNAGIFLAILWIWLGISISLILNHAHRD